MSSSFTTLPLKEISENIATVDKFFMSHLTPGPVSLLNRLTQAFFHQMGM